MHIVRPTRIPVWEKNKSAKKKRKTFKFLVLIVGLVIAANLLIKLPSIYQEVNTPFPRFRNEKDKKIDLDTSFRTNYLLISYEGSRLVEAAILSFEPVDKRLTLVFFDLFENKNLRKATNKVFRNEGVGGLQQFVSVDLAIPLDRYLAFEDSTLKFDSERAASIFRQAKSIVTIFRVFAIKQSLNKTLKTNFTTSELLSLAWKIRRGNYYDKEDNFNLRDTDGSGQISEDVRESVSGLFFDQRVIKEAAAVTIRNSSGVPGAGSSLAVYLTNLGANVVAVETGDRLSTTTIVEIKKPRPALLARLATLIPYEKKKAAGEGFSGDILIIVGRDGAEKLTN